MDPLSHTVIGALTGTALAKPRNFGRAAIVGALAANAADLDIIIRSKTDPLLSLEYHRHFTHSFLFIPAGGLIVAAAFWLIFRRQYSFKLLLLWSTVAFATHSLLDACTNYGTQLFWPFSHSRISCSLISIVDPLFTLALFVIFFFAYRKKSRRIALGGLLSAILYLSFGYIQRERVEETVTAIASERNHLVLRSEVKPSFGNLIVWRSIYETEIDHQPQFFVDAIRVPLLSEASFLPGGSVNKFMVDTASPSQPSLMIQDLQRFAWFSDSYLSAAPEDPNLIGDMRFSLLPQGLNFLWAVRIDPTEPDKHLPFVNTRKPVDHELRELMQMIWIGQGFRSLKHIR